MASFFETMTEEQFINSMQTAFSRAFDRNPPPPFRPGGRYNRGGDRDGSNREYDRSPTGDYSARYNIDAQSSFIGSLSNLPAEIVNLYDGQIDALASDLYGYSENLREIQTQFGSFTGNIEEAGEGVKGVIEQYRTVTEAFVDDTFGKQFTERMQLQDETVKNFFQTYFQDEAEMARRTQEITSKLVTQHNRYITDMEKDTILKLSTYTEALGVTADEVASVIERQIVTTGKANTDILDEIGAFAIDLEKKTGQPFKAITRFSTQMIANTKQFGIVTAEEATRAAASLMQLGIRYEDLVSMQNKFADFASTADMSGIVSQITGVQLDAMELSYRFSEDPDAAFEYLREQFIAQGFTPEMFKSLSKGLQRQLQDAIGMDMNQVFGLIDPQRQVVDGKVLDQVQKETQKTVIDTGKAFAETAKNGLDVFTRSTERLEEATIRARKKGLLPILDDLMRTQLVGALANEAADDAMQAVSDVAEPAIRAVAESGAEVAEQGLETFREVSSSLSMSVGDYFEDIDGQIIELTDDVFRGLYPDEYIYDGIKGAWVLAGDSIAEGLQEPLESFFGQSLSPFMRDRIVKPMIDPASYDPYRDGLYNAGKQIGQSFSSGATESLMIEDSMTIANRLLNSADDIASAGYSYGLEFGKGVELGYVNTGVGNLGLDNSLSINAEDIGLGVKEMTDAVMVAVSEEQTASGGQKIFTEILQPIVEAIRDEIVNLNKSQTDLFNKDSNIEVKIGEETIATIVKDAIIRNPTSPNQENSILIGTSG